MTITGSDLFALAATFVLCAAIGFERAARRKDAGVRTHILVGLGSCLFTLVSIEGLPALLGGSVTWDASRITAQIVSGIGFLGAGVIFVGHDTVRGLTTASAIWIAAAIGVACGSGMAAVAAVVVGLYFLAVFGAAPLAALILRSNRDHVLRLTYENDLGVLRKVMLLATEQGYESQIIWTRDVNRAGWHGASVEIRLIGSTNTFSALVTDISEINGMRDVDLLDQGD